MTDPGSSMSLTAVLVLTVVVLGLMGGWLGVLFFVARQPGGKARPDNEGPAHARQPEASPHREEAGQVSRLPRLCPVGSAP